MFAVLMTACGAFGAASDSGSARAATELVITVWPEGDASPARRWTLTCEPSGGSLPRPANACSRLTGQALQPPPRDAICTQVYGGPQKARVRGRFQGRAVDVRFGRTNGCEISRWNDLRFLFPVRI